jgi:hypothetical protein
MSVAVHTMEKARIGPSYEDPTEEDDLSDDGKIDQQVEIQKPGLHDVLLGRGGGTNNHTGNVQFRQLVNKHKMRYLACSKVEKPKVAREVVQLWHKLRPPGRFLQRKDETKKGPGSVSDATIIWIVVGDKKAREKASQCLRERTAEVIPYLSHLRQQQDDMTHQGVTMVQHQMQMNGSGPGNVPAARRNSLMNMPDQPTHRVNSMNRRGSMPVATTGTMPMTPMSMEMQSRRGSMPAVSHMQGQTLDMQQLMARQARQQQVLRDAYSAIERSGGASPQQVNSAHMMGQQQLLVERQAVMHQQHSNLDERAMMQKNNTNNMMSQRDQMMRNNMMVQQNQMNQENAMIRVNSMVQQYPPMLSPTHHREGQSQQYAQMGRSPRGMQNCHPHMAQQQHHVAIQRSSIARYNTTGQLPRDIQVPLSAGDDLEPLPYDDDDEPIPLSMVPDAPLCDPPKFVSPDVARPSDEPQQQHQYQQPTRRNDKIQNSSQVEDQDQNEYVDLQPLPLDYPQ